MSTYERLNEVFHASDEIEYRTTSKIVLFSDAHKGDGSLADDFSHNRNIYFAALKYYYREGFVYIDLGDSEELWKNRSFSGICNVYSDVFRLLHDFYTDGRLYMIYGNHDIIKRNPEYVKKNMYSYYNTVTETNQPLFENVRIHEGLILKNADSGGRLFLVHGHQGDLLNDIFWRLGRFMTRHIWRRLELFGIRDPMSASANYSKKKKVEKKLMDWSAAHEIPVVAGHTHRPVCLASDGEPYFNDGSSVHPNCITCLEIADSQITLVKWGIKTREDRTVFIDKEAASRPMKL